MCHGEWIPLFTGEAARRLETTIVSIAEDLAAFERTVDDWGAPLLHGYLARVSDHDQHQARMDDLIEAAVGSLQTKYYRPGLYGGFAGVGCAHGVPGIVGLLSEVQHLGRLNTRGQKLLEGACRWLVSQRLTDGSYASWTAPGVQSRPARLAWCYGPLGVAVVLLMAARATRDRTLEEEAIDIANVAARQRGPAAGVKDAGSCHGAAGNGHLFNRLYHATQRHVFREAAIFWFHRALALRSNGLGIAGYRTWRPVDNRGNPASQPWIADPHFLTGASGTALALLGAASCADPAWDRVLLSDVWVDSRSCAATDRTEQRRVDARRHPRGVRPLPLRTN